MSVNQLDDITQLFRYTWWAEDQLLAVVKTLTPEERQRRLGGSFPSILECFAHIATANLGWFRRWHGQPARPFPEGWPATTWDAFVEQWRGIRRDHEAFVAGLDLAALDQELNFTSSDGVSVSLTVGETLRHIVNHSTYHRGQIANYLRILGAAPPATDLALYYSNERAAAAR